MATDLKKSKTVIPHQSSVEQFHEKTDYLIEEFIRENQLPTNFIGENAFIQLVRHLNPLATYSHVRDMEVHGTNLHVLHAKKKDGAKPASDAVPEPSSSKKTDVDDACNTNEEVDSNVDCQCEQAIEGSKSLEESQENNTSPEASNNSSHSQSSGVPEKESSHIDAVSVAPVPTPVMKPCVTKSTRCQQPITKLQSHLPIIVRPDPPCVMCGAPTPTITSVLLNINDASKILMAGIMTGAVTLENASRSICGYPLRLCTSHSLPVYDMMVTALGGVRTVEELDRANIEKLVPALEVYKTLRSIRETMEKKPMARTQMGSFKMALRTFYKQFTPKHVLLSEEKEKERVKMNKLLGIRSSMDKVKTYLTEETIELDTADEMRLLEAIKLKEHPHFVLPNRSTRLVEPESQKTPDCDDQDLLYQTIAQRRNDARKRRYDSYPEEMRELMKPIDEKYEKQTAECRTEMLTIKQQKAGSVAPVIEVPPKRTRFGFSNPGAKQKRPPTCYSQIAAQRLISMQAECDGSPDMGITGKQLTKVIPDALNYKDLVLAAKNVLEAKPGFGQRSSHTEALLEPKQEQEDYGELLVPKEEFIDHKLDKQLEETKFDPTLLFTPDQHQLECNPKYDYAVEEEAEEIDVYSHDSPRKCNRQGEYYE